jgi:release factor glutamine methyltransferase
MGRHRKYSCGLWPGGDTARGPATLDESEEAALALVAERARIADGMRVLDMGCGSGVLGLTIAAERPKSHVTLADISEEALALTRENAEKLGIENIALVHSDLFSSISGTFDVIAANLPYVPEGEAAEMARELRHDPALALFSGADGLDLLRRFVPESFRFLKPGGLLALEIGHDQASQLLAGLESCGFAETEIRRDLSGVARFPFARHP